MTFYGILPRNRWVAAVLAILSLVLVLSDRSFSAAAKKPNVVLIMTDNHGAWTLGCYGNRDIRTPNIDRLAREGTLFTRAFASNPVCSPTRATFLTGLLPSQHGVHCFLRGGRLQVGPQAKNTLDEFTSFTEVLRDAGYSCGLVGKWHLGDNLKPQEGLNDYWITTPHGGTSTFYNAPIIENGKIRAEPKYLTDFWTEHAVKFIEKSKDKDKPFCLFLAYNGPYSLGQLLLREGRNRHAAYYADKQLPSFPREPTHPWQFSNRDYINNPVAIRRVATEVSGVDDGVGVVMTTLKKHGLDENTVVIFVADQGWVGGHGGFFGMGDHTRPLTACDGMMRIPMIWRHPGRIATGAKSDIMVTNYDFLPTMLNYLGMGDKAPDQSKSPGRDFSTELVKPGAFTSKTWDNVVFYEFENLRCIRTERWKYVHRKPNGPHELYDLQNDPLEQTNLVNLPVQRAKVAELKEKLFAFFDRHASPKYDLWRGGGSQTVLFQGIDEEIAQLPPVHPPTEEGFHPAKLKVPPGFTVELAAGPPLVKHPMMANFDDRGRLFIAESAGVNLAAQDLEKRLPNFIRMIEDTDGDGRFDRSTIFADKMTLPQGALWHQGALYVASPPNIWRLEDANDDGVADKREAIVSQFGYTGNGASVHGCFLGPDGRLYWCDGRHGHEFRDEQGNITSKLAGSYIFSCKPDGSDVRIHCGGGMDNPVEVDFTPEGEMLGTVNILYSRPRSDCLVHWLYGGAYPHSERVLGELTRTGPLLGPVHNFGHVAVSGMVRYRSGVLDRGFRDDLFVAIFNTGKVQRIELTKSGSTFRAQQREFLTSTSRDFHPTDVLEDADGSLLVIDTGGWFLRGCPTSQIAKPEVRGGIYRIRRTGMTPLVDPWGKRIAWNKLSSNQLVALLNDTRFKVRQQAIDQCARRGVAIVDALTSAVRRRDSRQRRNALWALTQIISNSPTKTQKARAAVRLALSDPMPSIRQTACQSIARNPDIESIDRLLKIVQNDEPAIRRAAAKALGRIGDSCAVDGLFQALAQNPDRSEEHALIFALIEINNRKATAPGLANKNANAQRAALIALDQIKSGDLQADQAAAYLVAKDKQLREAALTIFRRRRDWSASAAEILQQSLASKTDFNQSAVIQGLATAFAAEPHVAAEIGRSLANPKTPSSVRSLLLQAIRDGNAPPLHKSWIAPLERLLTSDDRQLLEDTVAAVGAIKTEHFNAKLREIGQDQRWPPMLRISALRASGQGRLGDAAFKMLTGLLAENAAPAEMSQAALTIGEAQLTKPQLIELARHLQSAGPLELRDLVKPFARNRDRKVAEAFLTSIKDARSFFSMPTHEFSDVVKRYPPDVLPLANELLDKLKQQDEQKHTRLEQLLKVAHGGDAAAGKKLFFSEKSKCGVCHRVGKVGGTIGPDLSRIGQIRSRRDLLEAIVFPSSSLVREYEPYTVITAEGRTYSGLIVRENDRVIHLQQQSGEPIVLDRDGIESIVPTTVSIMPKGLDQALTEKDLADVVAYLLSLK